ncbi:MAG: (d)CMP kinase [Fidelibacterota bacterium]
MIIAIDGPAASGKSTTARLVAERLGFTYLDTGAMYRAVTLAVIRNNIPLNNEESISALLDSLELRFLQQAGEQHLIMNGRDVSSEIRSGRVTEKVSAVSALPVVRQAMVKIQREIGSENDCVVEGRDIGTVVFPEAEYKFFIKADYETRARRRQKDLMNLGEYPSLDILVDDLKKRDQWDSSREFSPLKKAENAIELDTTNRTIEEQVNFVVNLVEKSNKGKQTNHE